MQNFSYHAPTEYVFGPGTEDRTGDLAKKHGMTRVLLVYGQGSVLRSGVLDRVAGALDKAGVTHLALGGVVPNPTDDKVYEGIALCRENNIDGIIAVGGGSAIDTAKAIAAGVPYEGDFWDFWAGLATVRDALPVGVVLTIPAAGSEGSGNSVITKLDGMRKISLRTDYWLRPRFAVLDPDLTLTLPDFQTFAGVVDMMAHIFERYYSPTPDCGVTDRLAEGLLMAIIDEARKLKADPGDRRARANIMWAATQAHNGLCGNGRAEDWASHGIEHELSALYGVTHGAGLAVVNPAWMTFMAHNRPAKVAQMARRVFGVDPAAFDGETAVALEGVRLLKDFYTQIGMPVTLGGLGIGDPDIDTLVRKLHENKGNPFGAYYPITPDVSRQIYTLML